MVAQVLVPDRRYRGSLLHPFQPADPLGIQPVRRLSVLHPLRSVDTEEPEPLSQHPGSHV